MEGQVAYLARHYRVICFDGRGNGLSDRPQGADAYRTDELIADAIAVMDATDTPRAVVIGFSLGGHVGANLAARHPDRVISALLICAVGSIWPATAAGSGDVPDPARQ